MREPTNQDPTLGTDPWGRTPGRSGDAPADGAGGQVAAALDRFERALVQLLAVPAELRRSRTVIRRLEARVRELEDALAARDRSRDEALGRLDRVLEEMEAWTASAPSPSSSSATD